MGFVLADSQGWLSPSTSPSTAPTPPFEVIPLQTFLGLREAVNNGTADFFMWEHFTSKKYYDNGEIKRIGEIYTPWSSWKIVASTTTCSNDDPRLEELFGKIDQGVKYFEAHKEEAVAYISTELDYSEGDAKEWLDTVRFAGRTKGVDVSVIQKTIKVLKNAGVLENGGMEAATMVANRRGAQAP